MLSSSPILVAFINLERLKKSRFYLERLKCDMERPIGQGCFIVRVLIKPGKERESGRIKKRERGLSRARGRLLSFSFLL